ncbi:hypothetical protein AgCh_005133 [Apium graveolens]
MEYVKDYMKLTEIGGVYTKAADGWKLLTRDKELLDLVNETKPDHELHLYVDTFIDKEVEPSVQMQPWRHMFTMTVQSSFTGSTKEQGKHKFVTSHQLQQEQQRKKNKQKSPELPRRILSPRKCNMPVAETPELEEGTLPEQPSQGMNKYELLKMKRVQENRAKFDELGLGKYGTNPTPPTVQNVKGKEKDNEERINSVKEKKTLPPGPRTRSRATVAPTTNTEAKSSSARKLINPTCSKLLKQCGNFESELVAAYIALRERQMQNLEVDPMIENVGESSLQNAQEVVEKGPKKPRGRTKMLKVHGRSANEKPVIKFSKRGQPIGDRKIRSELSNFLGTLVKDHVSLTHVNWHVVPQELKKNMVQYTLDRFDIPAQGEKYLNKTLNTLWRVHKSRVKKAHYTKYDSDEKRIQNKPHEIPLTDFKVLLKYWADEEVQENAARRNSYTDPHTLGRKTVAEVKEKLKTKDPNQASPSQAKVYFKRRKQKKGRKYKTNRDAIQKRMDSIDEMLKEGNDANVMLPNGKHGQDWLVGRQGTVLASENNPSIPEPTVDELTAKISQNLESEMEAKVNRKVQENMVWMLKKLAEANLKGICPKFILYVMSSALSLRSILDAHKLTGPNYADWLRNLRIVLRIEKLEYVIDSPKPTEPASDAHNDEHVVYRRWIDDANVAQCIMLASMNIELQKQHEHMDAHTILMHLQELYDVAGRTTRYEISKELFGCRMFEGSSVNDHVLKMINLIERLGQLGFAMDGELSQDLVLQSLPSSFSQFVMNFHMNKLDKSSALLIGEGSNPKKRKRNSSKKKKVGEKTPVPPKDEDPKSKVVCFHCNKVGHWKRNCKVYLAELKKKGSETTASDSAYVKKVDPDKLEYRSVKCSFVGYPKETLGYYFYTDHRVFVSRHANFLEKEFILEGNSGSKIELDEVQEAQTTTDQVETPVLTEQTFVE